MTLTGRKRHDRPKSLSHGRPTSSKQPSRFQSSQKTRKSINLYHQLQKAQAQALQNGNEHEAASLQSEIDSRGGLAVYQTASLTGQSKVRGGDTSKVLVEWVREVLPQHGAGTIGSSISSNKPLRMLEIGALSPDNACAQSKLFEMTRIDLRSLHSSIQQQDFMKRPLPAATDNDRGSGEKYDIISLSLVLNCVPDPCRRGEMLRRTSMFLRERSFTADDPEEASSVFPSLFLVLPAPCVSNSRYLNEERLSVIMNSLGYTLSRRKLTAKLIYYLWKYEKSTVWKGTYGKTEVNPGRTRNNFVIVLRDSIPP